MKPVIRIVIADDHPIFRQGLRQIIESDPMLEVVAEAEDGHVAITHIETLAPDVAILDVSMPGRDGLEVTRAVRDRRLSTAVICLTMHKDERFVNAALEEKITSYRSRPRSVGIGASGDADTARRSAHERPVATLDHRHFRVLQPRHVDALRLLPEDLPT
ncbi:MAG: response regulator [Luteitalea sp.]|nr:response regulator [Luteitalea sp.]